MNRSNLAILIATVGCFSIFYFHKGHAAPTITFDKYTSKYPYQAMISKSALKLVATVKHQGRTSEESVCQTWANAQQAEIDSALGQVSSEIRDRITQLFERGIFDLSENDCRYGLTPGPSRFGDTAIISFFGSRYQPQLTIPYSTINKNDSPDRLGERAGKYFNDVKEIFTGQVTYERDNYDYEVFVIPSTIIAQYLNGLSPRLGTILEIQQLVESHGIDPNTGWIEGKIAVDPTRHNPDADFSSIGEPYYIHVDKGSSRSALARLNVKERSDYVRLWNAFIRSLNVAPSWKNDLNLDSSTASFIDRYYPDSNYSPRARMFFFEARLFPYLDELHDAGCAGLWGVGGCKYSSPMTPRNLCKFVAVARNVDIPLLSRRATQTPESSELSLNLKRIASYPWCTTDDVAMVKSR